MISSMLVNLQQGLESIGSYAVKDHQAVFRKTVRVSKVRGNHMSFLCAWFIDLRRVHPD